MKLNVDFLVKLASKCGKVYEEEINKAVEEGKLITAADVVFFAFFINRWYCWRLL